MTKETQKSNPYESYLHYIVYTYHMVARDTCKPTIDRRRQWTGSLGLDGFRADNDFTQTKAYWMLLNGRLCSSSNH